MWQSCFCVSLPCLLSVTQESVHSGSNCLRGFEILGPLLIFLKCSCSENNWVFFLLLSLPCWDGLHPSGNNLSNSTFHSIRQANKHVLELKNKMTKVLCFFPLGKELEITWELSGVSVFRELKERSWHTDVAVYLLNLSMHAPWRSLIDYQHGSFVTLYK